MLTKEEKAKQAVRKHFHCHGKYICSAYSYCVFGTGKNTSWDANECPADEFANGYIAALNDLETTK